MSLQILLKMMGKGCFIKKWQKNRKQFEDIDGQRINILKDENCEKIGWYIGNFLQRMGRRARVAPILPVGGWGLRESAASDSGENGIK